MKSDVAKRIESINKGIIPEGYKKTKVGIVPVEWENMKFSDIFTEKSIRTSDFEKYPLYSLTIEEGVVPKSERYERSHLVKKDDVFKIVSENDYVYNPMNVRFGALARYKGKNPVSVSGYYDVFYVNDNYSMEYMDNFLLSAPMINYYNVVSTGSLKEKQRVHFSQFIEFNLPIPPLPEQQKIAEILSTQDKLIELQERKINQLKTLKKGYLQKMFPKKSCKYPELRFKGFTDAWEQRKLEEVITVGNGMDYKHLSEGGIPVYGTGGYMLSVDKALSYDKDAIGIGRKGTIDKPYVLKAPFWTVDTLFYCIPKEDYSLDFVYCIFQNVNWKEKDESTGVPSLSKVNINSTDVKVPALAEQEKIGAYFSNLDNLITLHQRKLDEEKQKKKALMQLLLTGKVRVKL